MPDSESDKRPSSDQNMPNEARQKNNDNPAKKNSAAKSASQTQQQNINNTHPQSPLADDKDTNAWALQAGNLAQSIPLIDCLDLLAGHYGRRTSVASLTAGLPLSKGGVSPQIFIRAAERADMNAQLVERSLDALRIAPNLPCILVLENGMGCILWGIRAPKDKPKGMMQGKKIQENPQDYDYGFIVQFPETPDKKQIVPLEQLKKVYTGFAFFLRPIAKVDDRAGPAKIDTARNWFWSVFKKQKVLYAEVFAAAIVINLLGIVSSLYVMNVYDKVVPNNAVESLWALTIGVCIAYLFDFILKHLRAHFLDHAGRKADVAVSSSLFEQILGMTMAARPSSAGVLASKMREFESVRDFYTSASLVALIDLPFIFLFILIIMVIGGPIAFVPLAAVPVLIITGLVMQKPLEKAIKESLNESALKNALLFETIAGLETIKVQASEGNAQRTWEELTEKASHTAVKTRQISATASHIAIFVQQLVSVFIVVAGVYLIAQGDLTMGGLIACVILSGRAMGPLAQVAGLLTRYNQSKQSLEHLDEMMRRPVERPADKNFITMREFQGKIEFRDVVFQYPGQTHAVLNEINFTIEPGERVGIIGAVGSGKTTLERLLLNLYQPAAGSVQLDGTDVRQIDPGDLRRNIGSVQQSPHLFYGSVRENITMGNETISDRAVLRAAELSGVMEFLKDSSAGLDTQVGERGEALSGGQRQSVAIARALLYNPPILVLDEPTASMDPASETRLRKRLGKLTEGRTTILITHRGSMLSIVEKLILMDRGKLVAYGPKEEVIKKLQSREFGTNAENTKV